eukprot:Skav231670  [mRNA]  locus=scaffold597:128676:133559:+ [translate_table: standard]
MAPKKWAGLMGPGNAAVAGSSATVSAGSVMEFEVPEGVMDLFRDYVVQPNVPVPQDKKSEVYLRRLHGAPAMTLDRHYAMALVTYRSNSFMRADPMDSQWIKRLLGMKPDTPLGLSFLMEYSRALRLVSGMRASSLGRLAIAANARRRDEAMRTRILNDPAVASFVRFLSEFKSSELPVVMEVITSSLLSSTEPTPFQAASVDPLLEPTRALQLAAGELSQIINEFPPDMMAPDVPSSSAAFQEEVPWNAGNFIATVYGVAPCPQEVLPSMVAGVCGPGADGCAPFHLPGTSTPVSDELHQWWRKSKKVKSRNRRQTDEPQDPSSDAQLHHLQQPRTPTKGPVSKPEEDVKPAASSGATPDFVEVQVEEAPAKRRRTRWDDEPEATPFRFALQFTPPVGVPDPTVQQMVRVVSHILREIRSHTFTALDFVIQIPNSDPALYSAITDFGVVLTRLAIRTRYSALSYGTRWALVYDSKTQEGHVLTVFLNFIVIPVRPAPVQDSSVRPRKEDKPPEGKRGRSPPPAPRSGGKPRKVFSGGRTSYQGKSRRRGFSCPPVVSDVTLIQDPIQDFTPEGPLIQVHPAGMPPAVGNLPSGPSVTIEHLEPWPLVAPALSSCFNNDEIELNGPALLDALQDADELPDAFEGWDSTQAILDYFAQAPSTRTQNMVDDPACNATVDQFSGATNAASIFPGSDAIASLQHETVSPTLPWNTLKSEVLEAPLDRHVSSKAVQVPCVGTVYQGDVPWPIFQAPTPPHPGAMVRRPTPEAVPRILELFAGLGGWKQAIRSLRPDDLVVSIEIDPTRAKYISSNYGIPAINSSDFVRFPPDEEAVVITDVRNSEWWPGTLDLPFTTIVYSAPCPPWSRGGTQAGFDSSEGLLLAHSIGLVHLFGVPTAAGENVDGLVDHPHWARVSALLDSLDRPTQVKVHDLGTMSGMTRKRSFLLTGASLQFQEWTPQQVNWSLIGARMTDFEAKGNLALPLDTSTPLFLTRFLPFDKRMQAQSLNVVNGPEVVQLRCHRGPVLPTLVASYRFQDKLDLAHLLKKGIFTWLVADDDFPFGVRFLHAFEAARCLGLQMDLRLPSDQSFAMQLLGNCVSPVQALWALSQLLPTTCDPYEVACGWLFHQLPLQSLRAVIFEDDMFLVQSIPLGRPHFLRADVQMISCDGALFPVPSPLAHSRTRVACTLPLAAPWSLLEVGRWLHEDSLLLIARVVPLQVMIGDVTVLLSPFAALDVLAPFLEAHTPSHLETNPLWTWFTNDMPVFQWPDQRLVVDPPEFS